MTDPKALIDRLLSETADTWDVMAANAEPPARRETLRECADLVRMLLSVEKSSIDTSLQPERAPTHRCTICGAFWMRWVAGWSLCSKQCGKCCDNAPMGEQIVPLIVSDIFGPADLITHLTAQLAAAEAEIAGLLSILENCTVESGVCCCGDNTENHPEPMSCGHSPVDSGGYAFGRWLEARQALASEPKS